MEEAITLTINALAGSGPVWLFVIGVLTILAFVVIKALPFYKDYKTRQLDIAVEREKRKTEAARMQHERDQENAVIQARMVDAQEASTAAVNGVAAQMALMNGKLEASQHGSHAMGEKVDTMATQVHEIHGVIVPPN